MGLILPSGCIKADMGSQVMAENDGLTLSDLKKQSPDHLSATLPGCEFPDKYLEPASATRKMSWISALIALMKSCRF